MPNLLDTVRDLDRLRQIVGVLASHGFGEVVSRTGLGSLLSNFNKESKSPSLTVGARLRRVLQDLGPSFIKLGQIASTRPDLLPPDVITELKKLQDDVPSESFEAIRAQIEGELGATLEMLYESFDETPLASASIGQVHRAQLRQGEQDTLFDVVVKVQRPGVQSTIERDIDLLYWLAHAVERSMPEARLYRPVKLVDEFNRSISAELDFVLEADHCERFAQNFADNPDARFPKVYRSASSRRVLTLEFFDGQKVYEAVAQGISGEVIAKKSIAIMIKQIFEDGFFHADPHPGNVIILEGIAHKDTSKNTSKSMPIIGLIDLGMVGHLTPQMRDRTIDLMVAAVREDYRGIADALFAIGRPTKKVDRDAYENEVALVAQRYLGKRLGDIQFSALLRDLVDGSQRYGIEIPPEFLMLGKSLMTVEGVGKEIYPELDIFEELKPYFLKLVKQRYSPERVTQDVMRGFARLSSAATEMPMQLQEILEDLRQGAFRIVTHDPNTEAASDRLGRRVFAGLWLATLVTSGTALFVTEEPIGAAVFWSIAACYGAGHTAWTAWLRRQDRQRS